MGTGNLQEELRKARQSYKETVLLQSQLEQLTWLNKELLQKLKATEKSHRSLMNYIKQMHRNLADNEHRTPIEEIWFRELGRYLRSMK
tara:strand:- start:83 stop:346 length:264 start_codon:yes stop_codon:yes gene_type:complete